MITKMLDLLRMIDEEDIQLNRLSVHAINFHMTCFDRRIWRGGKLSIAKAIIVSLQIAGGYSPENFHKMNEDLDLLQFNFPEKLEIMTTKGRIKISRHQLIQNPIFSFRYGKPRL